MGLATGRPETEPRAEVTPAAVPQSSLLLVISYSKRIGDAPPPTAATHGPIVEKKEDRRELLPA